MARVRVEGVEIVKSSSMCLNSNIFVRFSFEYIKKSGTKNVIRILIAGLDPENVIPTVIALV